MAVTMRAFRAACSLHARPVPPAAWRRAHQRSDMGRRCLRAAASANSDEAQAGVLAQVEQSTAAIEEMMGEISTELFLDAAVEHVTDGAQPGSTPAEVVSRAVEQRLDQLDSTFLATLDAYIQGASDKGAADVAEVLLMVRDEVLRLLGQRMPPELRLLDAVLAAPDGDARGELLKQHLIVGNEVPAQWQASADSSNVEAGEQQRGGSGDLAATLPCCEAADLESATSQLISDMELLPQIPDRRLLAKLVLLREEVQEMLAEAEYLRCGGAGDGQAAARAAMQLPFRQLGAVPRSCAVFLQRLMALDGGHERRALLEHALHQDTERLPEARSSKQPPTTFETIRAEAELPQEWVRPGRFLQSLSALQHVMLHPDAASVGETFVADAPNPAVLERLESIRRETLFVLLEMAGEGQPYLP